MRYSIKVEENKMSKINATQYIIMFGFPFIHTHASSKDQNRLHKKEQKRFSLLLHFFLSFFFETLNRLLTNSVHMWRLFIFHFFHDFVPGMLLYKLDIDL